MFRSGVDTVLGADPDISVVGEARDGNEAIAKALQLKPDVVLLEAVFPRCSGLQVLARIREGLPDTRVIILTNSECEEHVFSALASGAQGYLTKTSSGVDILRAVKLAAAGESMLSPEIATKLVAEFRNGLSQPRLSQREMQVLKLVSQGLTNTEIADDLCVSQSTVRCYLSRSLDKLHLNTRAEASAYYATHYQPGSARRDEGRKTADTSPQAASGRDSSRKGRDGKRPRRLRETPETGCGQQ